MAMTGTINDSLLAKIDFGRPSEHPHVGCFTCHQGRPRPAPAWSGNRPGGQGRQAVPVDFRRWRSPLIPPARWSVRIR